MSDERKPWMIPVQYNDDRFVAPKEKPFVGRPNHMDRDDVRQDDLDDRDSSDVEEILRRPDRGREEREYECTDTTPVNYSKGPHDQEFGVDEKEFDVADAAKVPYDNGPHEDEFGVEDDELEPLDDSAEFPED